MYKAANISIRPNIRYISAVIIIISGIIVIIT